MYSKEICIVWNNNTCKLAFKHFAEINILSLYTWGCWSAKTKSIEGKIFWLLAQIGWASFSPFPLFYLRKQQRKLNLQILVGYLSSNGKLLGWCPTCIVGVWIMDAVLENRIAQLWFHTLVTKEELPSCLKGKLQSLLELNAWSFLVSMKAGLWHI